MSCVILLKDVKGLTVILANLFKQVNTMDAYALFSKLFIYAVTSAVKEGHTNNNMVQYSIDRAVATNKSLFNFLILFFVSFHIEIHFVNFLLYTCLV